MNIPRPMTYQGDVVIYQRLPAAAGDGTVLSAWTFGDTKKTPLEQTPELLAAIEADEARQAEKEKAHG